MNRNGSKKVDAINFALDIASIATLNAKQRLVGWDPEKARKNFWVVDVMFNALYAHNLSHLADIAGLLGKEEDQKKYQRTADTLGEEIATILWNENDQMFYAHNDEGPITKVSVSNLFPIILPQTKKDQVEHILELLESSDYFDAEFPIPTIPRSHQNYDPAYSEKRIWRGPTWVNMNFHIAEGLAMQAERFRDTDPELAKKLLKRKENIVKKTIEMVDREGYYEFYNPETGEGLRITPFGWSALADVMATKRTVSQAS